MPGRSYDVIVIGGGPAGSSIATLLATRRRSVLLLEKERMPRDKLCGEFYSPEVADSVARLGAFDAIRAEGARPIDTAICTAPGGNSVEVELPGTAFGLSRMKFDAILFETAGRAGAALRDGTAVEEISGSLGSGFQVSTGSETFGARVVVGAYGRRAKLDRKLGRPSFASGSSLTAFKAHFEGRMPEGAVELHTFPGGYCGILREEVGRINVCWIARASGLKEMGGSPEAQLNALCAANESLSDRTRGLTQLQPFLAVSHLFFRRKELFASDVCMVGDAAGMIAPLCGDGMAMALQSAEIAAPLIDQFLDGRSDPPTFKRTYVDAWRARFRMRMVAGRLLHAGLTAPHVARFGLAVTARMPALGRFVVGATRG